MIHIAICDDEERFVSGIKSLVERYASEENEDIKISTFFDGQELINAFDTTIDLIFLDIQMKTTNGLETAEYIRKHDDNVAIIFLTTLINHAIDGYKYKASNYIIKPLKYARLKDELNKFYQVKLKEKNEDFTLVNDSGRYRVSLNSVSYIETYSRNLMFHTKDENIICYKKMKDVENELKSKGFARCHTSYLVNMFYIKEVKKLEIVLHTGEIIPISQPKRKEFMQSLAEYWGDII